MRNLLRCALFCGLLINTRYSYGLSSEEEFPILETERGLSEIGEGLVDGQTKSKNSKSCPGHCFHDVKNGTIDFALAFMGSNQAVHPDIFYSAEGFGPEPSHEVIGYDRKGVLDTIIAAADTPRWMYWMVITPYPYGNALYENPTIRVSNWRYGGWCRPFAVGLDPTGEEGTVDTVWVRDPVTTFGQSGKKDTGLIDPDTIWDQNYRFSIKSEKFLGHNSDPELVYDSAAGGIYLVFRSFKNQYQANYEILYGFFSRDGIDWKQRDTLTVVENDQVITDYYVPWNLISPTIARAPNGNFWLWSIDVKDFNSGTQMIRMEIPRIGEHWIKVDTCFVEMPFYKEQLWHMEINQWSRDGRYYMFGTLNPLNTNTYDTLGEMLYVSDDGLVWEFLGETVRHGIRGQWDYNMYRSTFLFDNNESCFDIPVWYSAASAGNVWSIGFAYSLNIQISGDFNDDCAINLLDILSMINSIYGDDPYSFEQRGDCNGDCRNNLLDILYLINFIYYDGIEPIDACSAMN